MKKTARALCFRRAQNRRDGSACVLGPCWGGLASVREWYVTGASLRMALSGGGTPSSETTLAYLSRVLKRGFDREFECLRMMSPRLSPPAVTVCVVAFRLGHTLELTFSLLHDCSKGDGNFSNSRNSYMHWTSVAYFFCRSRTVIEKTDFEMHGQPCNHPRIVRLCCHSPRAHCGDESASSPGDRRGYQHSNNKPRRRLDGRHCPAHPSGQRARQQSDD